MPLYKPEQCASGQGVKAPAMWWLLPLATVLVFSACVHEPPLGPLAQDPGNNGGPGEVDPPEVVCDNNTVWFAQQIQPLLVSNCTMGNGCHSAATDDNDHIDLTSYTSLMEAGIVQDGDLWEAINESDPDDIMPRPPQTPLTSEQIALIGQWIQQGAQNNSCEPSSCNTENVTYSGTILPVIQARCQGCHSGSTPQGGLDFTSWSVLNGVALEGRLAGAIQHLPEYPVMPPSGSQLSDCRIQQFLTWIEAGAPNN